MRRLLSLFALLIFSATGCFDPAKINDLAKQAVQRVSDAEKAVTSKLDTPASLLDAITDTYERMGDTLAAMNDEASARANVERYMGLLLELRGYLERLKKVSLQDEATQRALLAGRKRRLAALKRHTEETQRLSRSPEIRPIMAKAFEGILQDQLAWDFMSSPGSVPRQIVSGGTAPASDTGKRPNVAADALPPFPPTGAALPADSHAAAMRQAFEAHDAMRQQIDRMRQEHLERMKSAARPPSQRLWRARTYSPSWYTPCPASRFKR